MKIAIEAQRLYRKKKHGMDIVALELIRHLQKIDAENEYFILVKPDEDNRILKETGNFHIIEIPGSSYPVWEQISLPRALKKIKPDILHCTANTAPLNTKTPLVLTLHDIIFMDPIGMGKGNSYQRYGNAYRKWLVPRILNRCSKIITVSDFEKHKIEQYFSLRKGQVQTVYNAFSDSFGRIEDQKLLQKYREKYQLPDKFVLFLGNTDPKKNAQNVLKGFKAFFHKMGGHVSLVMPDADRLLLDSIFNDKSDLEIRKAIHLTGYIPNEELVYIYNMASMFLYPSLYESFGIPILEAMACGTPVLTSNVAAMPEIAGNAAKLLNPSKPLELAEAMELLLTNAQLRQGFINAGLQRINSFSWENTARNVLAIYTEIFHKVKQYKGLNCMA